MLKDCSLQSRSSSSATSSSASKPDPEDEEDEDEVDTNPRCLRALNRGGLPPPKSKTYINNDTPKLPRSNRISNQSPAVHRRNHRASDESPAPNRRAKSEALVRSSRAKDPSPAANVREPLTLSSLRAAAGNTSNSTPASRRKAVAAATTAPSNNATSKKKVNWNSRHLVLDDTLWLFRLRLRRLRIDLDWHPNHVTIWARAPTADVILLRIGSASIKRSASRPQRRNAKPSTWPRRGWKERMRKILTSKNQGEE